MARDDIPGTLGDSSSAEVEMLPPPKPPISDERSEGNPSLVAAPFSSSSGGGGGLLECHGTTLAKDGAEFVPIAMYRENDLLSVS